MYQNLNLQLIYFAEIIGRSYEINNTKAIYELSVFVYTGNFV